MHPLHSIFNDDTQKLESTGTANFVFSSFAVKFFSVPLVSVLPVATIVLDVLIEVPRDRELDKGQVPSTDVSHLSKVLGSKD